MSLRQGEISLWQQVVLARLSLFSHETLNQGHRFCFYASEAIQEADKVVLALRERLEPDHGSGDPGKNAAR